MGDKSFSLWNTFSIFSSVLLIALLFGTSIIGIVQGVKVGDWNTVLIETGGKIFTFDVILINETQYLLDTTATDNFNNFDVNFHLLYSLTLLFLFFYSGMIMFKFGNWISGQQQFNPIIDLIWVGIPLLIFFSLEFFYTYFILHTPIWPLQGLYTFSINIIKILTNIFF